MKTILVPTDFSPNATNALYYAAAMANQVKGKLIIANIINLPVTPLESGIVFPINAELKEDHLLELNKLSEEVQAEYGSGFEVEIICEYGYFMSNLNALVKAKAIDVVVMGTKGASNFLDKLVGTNTAEFIKIAACPVLAIPSEAHFNGIKNIAYASDFESEEKIFLQQLFGFAEPFNSVVSIVNILTNHQLDIVPDAQIMRDIVKDFPKNNYCITQIQESEVVSGLQVFVQENPANVLAFSIHKRGFVENLFHKSISNQLLHHPTLPLLALPENPYCKPISKAKTQEQMPILVK